MSYVHTDLQAMIDFRSRLMRFNHNLEADYRSMVGAWKQLGEAWDDDKYREFGQALEEVGRGIDRYLAATADHEQHLLRLIERIDAFLQVR
jgi:hypothetical protein